MTSEDYADIASRLPTGIARVLFVAATVCMEFDLTVSETRRNEYACGQYPVPHTPHCRSTRQANGTKRPYVDLGSVSSKLCTAPALHTHASKKRRSYIHDRPNARPSLSIRLVRAEGGEPLLVECATWTTRPEDLASLRTAHHKVVRRALGFRRLFPTELYLR